MNFHKALKKWQKVFNQAQAFYHQGQYDMGIIRAKQALQIAQKGSLTKKEEVASTIILGWFYQAQQKEAQHQALYEDARKKGLFPAILEVSHSFS